MTVNRAVVYEEGVRNTAQPGKGFFRIGTDRLIGEVGTRGNHRESQLGHQDEMKRRVRQHHAEVGIAGRHGGGDLSPHPGAGSLEKDDRRLRRS